MHDALAACYHLIFESWDASMARQAAALGPLIESACGKQPARILDAACGIGTQAIGPALRGHAVTGSDLSETALSETAIARSSVETAARNLAIPFYSADSRDLSAVPGGPVRCRSDCRQRPRAPACGGRSAAGGRQRRA